MFLDHLRHTVLPKVVNVKCMKDLFQERTYNYHLYILYVNLKVKSHWPCPKSRVRETLNFSMCADSSTNTMKFTFLALFGPLLHFKTKILFFHCLP